MDKDEYLIRYSPPTKYDQMPLGSKIRVLDKINNTDKIDYYVQRSSDEENPRWVLDLS